MFRLWKRRPRTIVIGQQMADARRAERMRVATRPDLPSPMPKETYTFDDGYLAFLNPTRLALDSELAQLCRKTSTLDAAAHAQVRRSISMDEFYTLIAFSRRMALFAIREQSVDAIRDGLNAIALIEPARVDYRDIPMALGLLCYAAGRVGASASAMLREASTRAESDVAHLMSEFSHRRFDEKELREISGLQEIQSKYGAGLVQYGYRHYAPSMDLVAVMVDLAELLQADQYRAAGIQIATDLPPVWLRAAGESAVKKALHGVMAGASVSGFLRPEVHPTYEAQHVLVFVVELPDGERARALEIMSRSRSNAGHSILGCADGSLFCLVVARSMMQGVDDFETSSSLERFAPGVAAALRRSTNG